MPPLNSSVGCHFMLLRTATIAIALVVLLTAALAVSLLAPGPHYFPTGALGSDQETDAFRSRWYSQHLKALGEPVLYKAGPPGSFRFTWLRSFHHCWRSLKTDHLCSLKIDQG